MHKFPEYLHHHMKHQHVSQPLCTCSTDSVNECGKIHTNPYYSKVYIPIHKTHSKEYKKTIYHHQKLLIFENEQNQRTRMPCILGVSTHKLRGIYLGGSHLCLYESAHPHLACLNKHICHVNRLINHVPKHYFAPNFMCGW